MKAKYLSEKEVSKLTGFSLSKIQKDRFHRRGLPYIKLGRSIRYDIVDIEEYMNQRKVSPED